MNPKKLKCIGNAVVPQQAYPMTKRDGRNTRRVEVVIEDYEGGKPCYERKSKN